MSDHGRWTASDGALRLVDHKDLSPTVDGLSSILVIGYGNTLRGDDAVGPLVAEAVAGWGLPGVVARVVHQLTPELVPGLAKAALVVFVDARQARHAAEAVDVRPLEPTETGLTIGHSGDPRDLLALTAALYGRRPPAWWVTVPATRFEMGAALSTEARAGMERALERIRCLVGRTEAMHEIGMFQQALDDALAQALQCGATRVAEVTVQIGAASGVAPDVIEQAFAVLVRDTIAADASLQLNLVSARCACPHCGAAFAPVDELRACPECSALGAPLVTGHEFGITALAIESSA